MKKKATKILAIGALIIGMHMAVTKLRFSYIGYNYPSFTNTTNDYLSTVLYKPTQPCAVGIALFVDKSFYTRDSDKVNLYVSAKLQNKNEKPINTLKIARKLSELPYRNYEKIVFDRCEYNQMLDTIEFTIDSREIIEKDPKFRIVLTDDPITAKNEYPKIIYQTSIADATRDARHLFWRDKPFAQMYTGILVLLVLVIIALFLTNKRE